MCGSVEVQIHSGADVKGRAQLFECLRMANSHSNGGLGWKRGIGLDIACNVVQVAGVGAS